MFDRELLDSLVEQGWLRSQRHPDTDLWIYNYTEKAQFEKHWTPETLACRGLILDADGAVVARPFPKFFNLHELPGFNAAEHGSYRVTEKIDGSLGIVYWIDGEADPRIATRGSFISEQAIEGTRMIQGRELEEEPDYTPLFEIVYPENRIVVDYGERRELIFLDAIEKATGDGGFDFSSWIWGRAEVYEGMRLEALVNEDRPNCEGYVVAFDSGIRVKIKHAEYVRLHKLITGVNARHIWEILGAEGDLASMLDGIPDELHQWIQKVQLDLFDDFMAIESAAADVFAERPETDDRRALAEYFKASGANTAVLFKMLDGKPYRDLIWKAIKPEPETPGTIWTRNAEVAA